MKIFFPFCFAITSVAGFAPAQRAFVHQSSSLQAEQQTRGAFLSQAVAAITASLLVGGVVTTAPAPANAAKYGSFGAGSPLALDPTEADIDRDILGSSSVQSAIRKVQEYQTKVKEMQASLVADNQANLRKTILKDFDFAQLRDTLNSINEAVEEESQKGTDRLIRAILQDLTELEIANTQKEGIQRSPRRLEIMNGKLAKLDQAFNDYLAFAK